MPIRTLASDESFDLSFTPPGSKSITNRALLLASLAEGESVLHRPLIEADDTRRMLAAVAHLGATVEHLPGGSLKIGGVAGRWKPGGSGTGGGGGGVTLELGNAGTATRFLAAASILSPVPVVIDGNARMRQRPIGELTGALAALGAQIQHLGAPDCPPVRIVPPPSVPEGPTISFGHLKSSQFVSALLLLAPWIRGGLTVRHTAAITSPSYIWMSLRLLDHLGASIQHSDDLRVIRVSSSDADEAPSGACVRGLRAFELAIEPDASSATYWWAAAAMNPHARAIVQGLTADSLQGDTGFPELLERMGASVAIERSEGAEAPGISCQGPPVLRPIMADMTDMPDAAMSLAAVACFAPGASIMRGLATLRVKECDRIGAMERELGKIGVRVETNYQDDPSCIKITPPMGGIDCSHDVARVEFDTYDDHRMAMSLALIGLRRPNVFVRDPACVNKTYPAYWDELARLTNEKH
ncbi:3-phosphoshikimate 1-carboxyvinyltransferase [Nodularia spumigena]|uniref:3-phosphoshikimate 1-carboxyvinyltransferase n=1 Tax=Nodularia spumigena TaxID=70799 RepID=UPI002B20835D|nr:3-phosphoshikimate 1-carboxyvinyltransferase [Nodularia spumigena]MEA5556257.1 3-phosphoshikimate 1-carboxyvinyltransferase [Nodularia spumigena CH309]